VQEKNNINRAYRSFFYCLNNKKNNRLVYMTYNSYQIADIIGVNVSTIKRWTNAGKLQCYQTVGGHRKFHLNDISNFLKKNKKYYSDIRLDHLIGGNIKLIDAINDMNFKYIVSYSFIVLKNGDTKKFISLTNSLILKNYPLYSIFDNILNPVLERIGKEWKKGQLTISQEHLATEIIKKIIANINFQHEPKKATQNAFCFTLINDKHDIPLHMGEAIINQAKNIKTYNLGSNLPANDFISLSKKINPDIIFISIIFIENKKRIIEEIELLYQTFKDTKTKIYLRGAGVKKLKLFNSYFTHIESFQEFHSSLSIN
tara:strand:- start:45 stop:989 length:945 start_codon:yes stop_codon:yes gene_type:complete